MTISEQESMFTGGSENPPTILQIGLGASINLDSASLSVSAPMNKVGLSLSHKFHSLQVSIWEIDRRAEEKIVHPPLSQESEPFHEVSNWLWDVIRHTAILRLFQIWSDYPLSNKEIYLKLGAGKRFESSVAGMVSILSQKHVIGKIQTGKWIYNGIRPHDKSYGYRDDFSDLACRRCKEIGSLEAKKIQMI